MLIYNFQKEFLGIDEKDLKTLGFKNLAGLRAEVTDFADLFVKTPGYVHNFKHVHWIDFITCAESSEESKVIINVNNKNYKCIIQIGTIFLVDDPSSKAYAIHLNNLRELSAKESERISGDITTREVPDETIKTQQIFNTPELSDEFDTNDLELESEIATPTGITEDPYETPIEIDFDTEDEILDEESQSIEENAKKELQPEQMSLDIGLQDNIEETAEVDTLEPLVTTISKENFDNGYIYDPKVASDELGLPLDLIEEFIQDFIEQAKEFKEKLYRAIDEQDLENLRILSHKLKGVAANLRIEDALETLTIVNTADDLNVVEENLNTFYKIIAKLAGEEIAVEKEILQDSSTELQEEDTLELSLKDEPIDNLYLDSPHVEEKITFEEETKTQEPEVIYAKDSIASEIGIDSESFNELFDDYTKEAKELSIKIQNALENNDLATCKNTAIKLKGMSDNMRLTSFSGELETIIHAHDIQEVQKCLNTITATIAELSN